MIDRELIAGPRGTALQMDLPPMEGKTTLAQWFMTLPGQHPFWSKYVLSVIHLRDEESTAPAKKDYPEATYEICLIALDPERKPVPENRNRCLHGNRERSCNLGKAPSYRMGLWTLTLLLWETKAEGGSKMVWRHNWRTGMPNWPMKS